MLAWGERVSRQRLLRGKGFVVEGNMARVMNGQKLHLAATQSPGAGGTYMRGFRELWALEDFQLLCVNILEERGKG